MKKTEVVKAMRPPIVTIMGHVDHGKTTLLDAIRSSRITAGEEGGITQHIGAYQAQHQGKWITFIDTPGHAAFSKMRERGAKVTDIAVLVVAANDGIKPQTVESIKHIQAAKVPLVVAINKIDVVGASADMVKAQLTEYQIFCEGYGGQVPAVSISALKKEGIGELMETILLLSELEELDTNPQGNLEAVIIETKHDKHRGPVATVIVKNGTLKTGDIIWVDNEATKVRALFDEFRKSVKEAGPGKPVEIMGFKTVPHVGSSITSQDTIKEEVIIAAKTEETEVTTEAPAEEEEETEKLKLIIKADTQGTLEAIKNTLTEDVALVGEGIGVISESDVMLAHSVKAEIIGFRVEITHPAERLAEIDRVKVQEFDVIYRILEYIEKRVLKILEPTIDEQEQGTLEIVTIYDIKKTQIAGCKILTGIIHKADPLHVVRDGKTVFDVRLRSLKRGKEDITEAKAGSECGLMVVQNVDLRSGDVLKSYKKML